MLCLVKDSCLFCSASSHVAQSIPYVGTLHMKRPCMVSSCSLSHVHGYNIGSARLQLDALISVAHKCVA